VVVTLGLNQDYRGTITETGTHYLLVSRTNLLSHKSIA